MPRALPRSQSPQAEAAVVTTAVLRAADRLGLTDAMLARILGVSAATVSRMRNEGRALDRGKPFELAVLFVRLYRSLDAIVGGDDAVARQWMVNANTALGARPLDLIVTVIGLANVIAYLDARRALV
jgi:uncharacterized protein (DUF2384 family)